MHIQFPYLLYTYTRVRAALSRPTRPSAAPSPSPGVGAKALPQVSAGDFALNLGSGQGRGCGKAEIYLLWLSCCLAHSSGSSPQFHQKFTRSSAEFHRNFTRISNWSTLTKRITTTRPSHSSGRGMLLVWCPWVLPSKMKTSGNL